jgi:hypothetical protein
LGSSGQQSDCRGFLLGTTVGCADYDRRCLWIAALYEIEADIRATPAEHRQRERQQRSRPLVEAMHTWLTQQLERSLAVPHWFQAVLTAVREAHAARWRPFGAGKDR